MRNIKRSAEVERRLPPRSPRRRSSNSETCARPAGDRRSPPTSQRPARVGRPGAGGARRWRRHRRRRRGGARRWCSRSSHSAPSRSAEEAGDRCRARRCRRRRAAASRAGAVGVVEGDALVVQPVEHGDAIARARQILRGVGVERDRRQRAAVRVEAGDAAIDVVEDDDAAPRRRRSSSALRSPTRDRCDGRAARRRCPTPPTGSTVACAARAPPSARGGVAALCPRSAPACALESGVTAATSPWPVDAGRARGRSPSATTIRRHEPGRRARRARRS